MTVNGNFLERWGGIREKLDFADDGILTTRGIVAMSACCFLASFCAVAVLYKQTIPPNHPVVLDFLPLWALIVVGAVSLASAIAIMSPVEVFIVNRDSSYQKRAQKKKQKYDRTVSSRRSNAIRAVSTEFSSLIHSAYLGEHLDPAFARWLYATLSFGMSRFDWDELYGQDSQFAEQEAYGQYRKTSLEPYIQEARSLVKIWKSAYAFDNLTLGFSGDWGSAANSIQLVGRALGIEEMVSSYYEGVPLEIVIAH